MNQPMFTLNGEIVHVFVSPKGVNKKTGEEYGGQDKVQILGNIPVDNGQFRKEIVTLTTDQGKALENSLGRFVSAPVASYARNGNIQHYIPRGSQIALGEGA